ncbi:MAG: holo-ACP synthase [Polyangiaceae bacterium]
MVVGLGIDVCSVERMQRALERHGDNFWQRILTPAEQRELAKRGDRAVALAGRFAAKEAASKALGAPKDVWWQSVEVLRGNGGVPTLYFSGPALPHLSSKGVVRSLISITHDAGVAAAVVVLEGA